MTEYHSIFKCRLCGYRYASGCIYTKEIMVRTVMDGCFRNVLLMPNAPSIIEMHSCQDGSVGVADFQGFRRVNKS